MRSSSHETNKYTHRVIIFNLFRSRIISIGFSRVMMYQQWIILNNLYSSLTPTQETWILSTNFQKNKISQCHQIVANLKAVPACI
jgi:hypothetical protein